MKVNMRGINIVLIIALLTAILVITPAAAKTWTVCSAGCDFTDIGDAIGGYISDGDTIYVYNGTYGRFSIERSDGIGNITVKGEGADVVTIDCASGEIRIGDSWDMNGAVLDGFKVINSATGVMVGCFGGQAQNCIIRNCVFDGMTANAEIRSAYNTTITNNLFVNWTPTNSPLYLKAGSDFSTVDNNTFKNQVGGSRVITIREANNCTVINNIIVNNTEDAIRIWKTSAVDNTITKNNISSNGGIIYLKDAGEGNKIYLNDFIDNTAGVTYSGTPPTTIYWNSTEQIEYVCPTDGNTYTNYLGNYWSDYGGTDGNGDGIGDTAYDIPGGSDHDYRPLMAKYENYPAPAAGICGDVNKDSAVNVLDATKVKNRAGNPLYPLDDEWAADVNCDKFINVLDATKVKNRAGNQGYPLNCCT